VVPCPFAPVVGVVRAVDVVRAVPPAVAVGAVAPETVTVFVPPPQPPSSAPPRAKTAAIDAARPIIASLY
jgi:hypothetical protein